MNGRAFAFVLGAALLAILSASAGWVAHRAINSGQTVAEEHTPVLGPEFSLTDDSGRQHRLSDYRGKVVLLNFWATWCTPCVREMPMLMDVQQEYGPRGLQVLGLTMDRREAATAFARELGINYPLLGDNRSVLAVQDAYGENRLPHSVLIDRNGRVVWEHAGELQREALLAAIMPVL